jgi:cephalosporin-C deacetylase
MRNHSSFHTFLKIALALEPLLVGSIAAAQPLTFTPFHETGIYALGETAGWTVSASADLPDPYHYVIKKNNSDIVKSGDLEFTGGHATLEAAVNEPAMLYVEVTSSAAGSRPMHLGAAVAPEKLQLSAPRPSDFDNFWDGKLKALAAIPINPRLTPGPTKADGLEFYTVQLDSLGSHVQGYLAKPAAAGKFPALVIFQYAGVYPLQPKTVTDRAAEGWLAFDVDSHDMPPDQATAPANYNSIGNHDRETSYFLNMYLRDSRAIDYIAGRPDWDGKTIVVMGTSMGGQQSLVAAGLNHKVTALIVNEPSGADSNGDLHERKAGYPNWLSSDPQVAQTALYFDTVNFASRIQAAALAAVGFIDTTAPPVGIWTAFNQIAGPKEMISMVESDHNNRTPEKQGAYNSRSKQALAALRNGELFLPAR